MLTRSDKEAIINEIREDLAKAQGVFLTNLIGIPANDAVAVRRSVRGAQGKLVVTRNTLFLKAAKGGPYEALFTNLKGPHAAAFAYNDAAAVAKCLKKASEELELVQLKGGVLEGKLLSVNEVKALASLPSKDQMLGTLLATFIAPVSALARVLHAVKEKKEAAGATA
jgi:large subunit ribosomal protein L10